MQTNFHNSRYSICMRTSSQLWDSTRRILHYLIHISYASLIQTFLTNQIAANEIIIVMTPYCPTPQHFLHMQEGVNLQSLKTGESKCPGYLHFLWNYSQTHNSGVSWYTCKWTLGHRRKRRLGTTTHLLYHYQIYFFPSLTRKLHILDNSCRIYLVK